MPTSHFVLPKREGEHYTNIILYTSIGLYNIQDSLEFARTWRLMGEPEKSLLLEENYISSYIQNERRVIGILAQHLYFVGIGIDYALLGQEEKAREIIANCRESSPGLYAKAQGYAVLGEREEAMRLLNDMKNIYKGYSYLGAHMFKHDYFMKNMFGYEPFEEFTRVRD